MTCRGALAYARGMKWTHAVEVFRSPSTPATAHPWGGPVGSTPVKVYDGVGRFYIGRRASASRDLRDEVKALTLELTTLLLPRGADVKMGDTARLEGEDYEVLSTPILRRSHKECTLRRLDASVRKL